MSTQSKNNAPVYETPIWVCERGVFGDFNIFKRAILRFWIRIFNGF